MEQTKEWRKRAGNTTKERYGHEHYVKIGKMGGAKVREAFRIAREKTAIEG